MTRTNATSAFPSINSSTARHKHRVNWHEAAACAIEIELRDYADMLQFLTEYILGRNSYRIDLLVIRKLSDCAIPKNIARIFRVYNLFELKGVHSSLTANAYYKTIGYAGILIDQLSNAGSERYTSLDVSITFLTFRYPRKLMKHLTVERHLTVEKSSKGVYHISIETFDVQIIVTRELPPEDNLYLCCLTNDLKDRNLINRLTDDYTIHQGHDVYRKYMNQLATANMKTEGESPMVCEGILNLCGTSSEEIIAKAKKESDDYYLPKIDELTASNEQLASTNEQLASTNEQLSLSNKELTSSVTLLSSQLDHLQDLLRQNNISFE
ncbi:MAG: hypothetical protein HDR18_04550 [Lachnospiraceae bacterium]|nr:hypothetical protein [Lachnospiraceae bacterium]